MEPAYCGLILHLKSSGIGKKWSKKHGNLYNHSPQGLKRIELCDIKDKLKKQCIPLEKCSNMEKDCIQDGKRTLSALKIFYSDTNKTPPLIFAWECNADRERWFNAFSQVLFGINEISENTPTFSQGVYDVEIRPNELTEKWNMKGAYTLTVTKENIELRRKTNYQCVMKWPLHYLRKYGRDKQVFSLEAGRRCNSGAGMFYFKTDQYNAIFLDVDKNVKALASRSRAASTSGSGNSFLTTSKPSSNLSSPPDSPRAPIPTPNINPLGLYDNPLDAREYQQEVFEATYSYDEPIKHKSPKLAANFAAGMGGGNTLANKRNAKRQANKEAAAAAAAVANNTPPPLPVPLLPVLTSPRNSMNTPPLPLLPILTSPRNSSNNTPPPPLPPSPIVDDTYAVADELLSSPTTTKLPDDLTSDYSRLSIHHNAHQHHHHLVQESEYDALEWNSSGGGGGLNASPSSSGTIPLPNNRDYVSAFEVMGESEYATTASLQGGGEVEDCTYDHLQ